MADLRAYAREAARRSGIDPDRFVRQIQQESGFDPDAHNDGSGADGIAQIVVRWHPSMAGKTRDPFASLDYAAGLMRNHLAVHDGDWARALSAYNAGPGATAQGLAGTLDGWPYEETVRYVSTILQIGQDEARRRLTGGAMSSKVTYDRLTPAIAQNDSWSCAPTSTRWALTALGRRPTEGWIERQMLADGVVTVEQGLMDASGRQLAAWIEAQYGEFGFDATNENPVSFQALAEEFLAPANPYPGLLGGRAWNHWAGLRGYARDRDVLLLANPDENWKGVGSEMTRAEFAALGPFSLVRVLHPDLLESSAPPPPVQAVTRADLDIVVAQAEALMSSAAHLANTAKALRDRLPA